MFALPLANSPSSRRSLTTEEVAPRDTARRAFSRQLSSAKARVCWGCADRGPAGGGCRRRRVLASRTVDRQTAGPQYRLARGLLEQEHVVSHTPAGMRTDQHPALRSIAAAALRSKRSLKSSISPARRDCPFASPGSGVHSEQLGDDVLADE